MPDTKITALTAIGANPIIPATFPIPMVDLTDTSMAASGTTKKVTVNQILGAGGTATLASATITGDLTVRTNVISATSSGVGFGINTAAAAIDVVSSFQWRSNTGGTDKLAIFSGGAGLIYLGSTTASALSFLYNGSTAMTLNATGLGVGQGTINAKVDAQGASSLIGFRYIESTSGGLNRVQLGAGSGFAYIDANASLGFPVLQLRAAGNTAVTIDSSLNVGIGVAASYNLHLGGTDPTLAINATNQSISSVSKLLYRNKDGNGNTYSTAGVYCETAGNGGYGNLVFYSAFNNGLVERLRMDSLGNSIFTPSVTPPTLSTNGQLVFNMTSNTNLRFSYRGSDGVTRVANITLA